MKLSRTLICTLAAAATFAAVPAAAQSSKLTIGGEPVATLTRPQAANAAKPQFVSAEFLPGEGMNLIQVKAFIPGKGVVPLFFTPPLPDVKAKLEGDNPFGNEAFKLGGAFLLPYPNRIRGKLTNNGTIIETEAGSQHLTLPANWHGVKPGAEVHAIHGLILNAKFGDLKLSNGPAKSEISASFHGGNFNGHWPSKTDVKIQASLTDTVLDLQVTATNVGTEIDPMAIGMHPYFAFPSGERDQARVHLPATIRTPANNYDDVFPLGTLEPVKGTRFDFTAPDGATLGTEMIDDCFTGIKRNAEGNVEIRVTDPAANYGLKVLGISKQIKAIQMYAPLGKNFVAIEPQYNLGEPFNKKLWGATDTGIVYLKPGESTTWHIQFVIYALK